MSLCLQTVVLLWPASLLKPRLANAWGICDSSVEASLPQLRTWQSRLSSMFLINSKMSFPNLFHDVWRQFPHIPREMDPFDLCLFTETALTEELRREIPDAFFPLPPTLPPSVMTGSLNQNQQVQKTHRKGCALQRCTVCKAIIYKTGICWKSEGTLGKYPCPRRCIFCIWQANRDEKEKQKSGFKVNIVQNVELEGSSLSRKTSKSIRQIKRLMMFLLKLTQLQVSTNLQKNCMMKNLLEIFSGMTSIWCKMPQELARRNIHPPKIPQKANVLEPYTRWKEAVFLGAVRALMGKSGAFVVFFSNPCLSWHSSKSTCSRQQPSNAIADGIFRRDTAYLLLCWWRIYRQSSYTRDKHRSQEDGHPSTSWKMSCLVF